MKTAAGPIITKYKPNYNSCYQKLSETKVIE